MIKSKCVRKILYKTYMRIIMKLPSTIIMERFVAVREEAKEFRLFLTQIFTQKQTQVNKIVNEGKLSIAYFSAFFCLALEKFLGFFFSRLRCVTFGVCVSNNEDFTRNFHVILNKTALFFY